MNHRFSQLSRHIKNVLVALSFGVILGVPVGNAIAEARHASRPQEMQIEKSTFAAAAVLALLVQYRKKHKPNDQAADNGKNQTSGKPKENPKDKSKARAKEQSEGNPSNPPSRSRGFGKK